MTTRFPTRLLTLTFLLIAALPLQVACAADEDDAARSILKKADLIRFPNEGFEVLVSINTSAPGQAAENRKYRVMSKGNENTIVLIIESAAERG